MAKKKRYYQGMKDRMDERYGEIERPMHRMMDNLDEKNKMHDKSGYHGGYSMGGRANAKSPMIEEEYNMPSNLPRDVKMKMYPRLDYMKQGVYDSMEGTDSDVNESVMTANKHRLKRRRY
jgi:hypothetical protein